VNHPFLVRSAGYQKPESGFDDEEARQIFAEIDAQDRGLRSQQRPVHEELSGKLQLLHSILVQIKASKSGDRIVIISNWTTTLDVIEKMCEHNGWPTHRLDGTMAIGKRMKLVQDFNRLDNPKAFAFLLSSKAGGCGLNLIGASRLVMYDPDWNPANDRQAMARIWRDGQKKPCFIYRLFTTGTIDEKVYQRQICKDGLSTMMVTETGDEENADVLRESLAADLVKDLFSFDEETPCATHDMLECKRCLIPTRVQTGGKRVIDVQDDSERHVAQELDVVEDELCTWSHHPRVQGVPDDILKDAAKMCTGRGVTFTMGCHIEYTPEMIARLEEEDRALQQQRQAASESKAKPAQAASETKPAQEKEQDVAASSEDEDTKPLKPMKRSRKVWKEGEIAEPA
jgi:DNA repair and recombination RAD54-like protein